MAYYIVIFILNITKHLYSCTFLSYSLHIQYRVFSLYIITALRQKLHIIPYIFILFFKRGFFSNSCILLLSSDFLILHSCHKLILHGIGKFQLLIEHILCRSVKHPVCVCPQNSSACRTHFRYSNMPLKTVIHNFQLFPAHNSLFQY